MESVNINKNIENVHKTNWWMVEMKTILMFFVAESTYARAAWFYIFFFGSETLLQHIWDAPPVKNNELPYQTFFFERLCHYILFAKFIAFGEKWWQEIELKKNVKMNTFWKEKNYSPFNINQSFIFNKAFQKLYKLITIFWFRITNGPTLKVASRRAIIFKLLIP